MEKKSSDYHDYVIRDGKLIGEFEQMYRHSENVPWHQNEQADWIDVRLTTQLLQDLAPFDEIHDLGCGLGYYLALLRQNAGSTACRAFGYDISPTACEKARALFPDFRFTTLDLTQPAERTAHAGRRLFVIRGTLWYVFPKIAAVVSSINNMMGPDDFLLIVQNFPPLDKPFVGKDVIPDHSALVRHFSTAFEVQRHLWYTDTLRTTNDNWFLGVFKPLTR